MLPTQLSSPTTPTTAIVQRRLTTPVTLPATTQPRLVHPKLAEESVWLDMLCFVKRHYGMLALAIGLGLLAAYGVNATQTPEYRAAATIEIQDLNDNFLNLRQVSPISSLAPSSGGTDMQTQLRILQSNSLIARVLPKLPGENVPPPSGARAWIDKLRSSKPVAKPNSPAAKPSSDDPLENARLNLQVRETRQARIVDLSYDSADPAYAAAFVNQLAQEYIDQSVESRLELSRSTSAWLEKQLAELRGKLASSEKQLQDYARRTGLLVTSEEHRPSEEKLRQIQEALSKAQENRMTKQARMETAMASPLDSIEVPLGSALRDHQAKLADLRRQRADLVTVYTPSFDGVKRLDSQIASLEASLRTESRALLQGIRNDYDDAARRERLLDESYRQQVGQVTEQAGIAIQYGILRREADTNRELYNTMLQRTAEAKVASAMRASIARLVDGATPPRLPYSPNRILNLAWGATAGLLLGLVIVTARNHSDPRIQQPGDVALKLNLAELGAIPAVIPLAIRMPKNGESGLMKADGTPEGILQGVAFETWNHRSSAASASYRSVLTSILFSQESARSPQVIVVTSPSKDAGKTTLVANLASALAHMKQTVLLVDAAGDRGLQQVFCQSQDYGLHDVLEMPGENVDLLPYIIHPTSIPYIFLVMTGPSDTTALDLLYAEGMEKIVDEMRRTYDVVIIDAPALEERPDARAFGRLADGVVLVVRAGQTTLEAVQTAAARLQEDGSVVLGTVLNYLR